MDTSGLIMISLSVALFFARNMRTSSKHNHQCASQHKDDFSQSSLKSIADKKVHIYHT